MLKTACTACSQSIVLPFFSAAELLCPNCGEQIPANDVFVSAGPYTIHRDVLIKNIYKYKRLIHEAEKEVAELQKHGRDASKYDVSIDTIGMLIVNLKEMLDGCRENLRHRLENATASLTIDGKTHHAKVANLSLTGICLEATRLSDSAMLWKEVEVHLETGAGRGSKLGGKVMWIGGGSLLGIQFLETDSHKKEFLKDYIMRHSKQASHKKTAHSDKAHHND